MRKTKIICTIGPVSENEEVLTQMCQAGMNVARLNFSHGTYPEHKNFCRVLDIRVTEGVKMYAFQAAGTGVLLQPVLQKAGLHVILFASRQNISAAVFRFHLYAKFHGQGRQRNGSCG